MLGDDEAEEVAWFEPHAQVGDAHLAVVLLELEEAVAERGDALRGEIVGELVTLTKKELLAKCTAILREQ